MNVIERAKAYVGTCNKDGFGCRCEARVSAECGCSGVKWASAGESASIITDLLSIVERLPKDAEGNPVCDGDVVYDFDRYRVFERHVRTEAWELNEDGEPECAFGDISDCFPTRVAAEAAREGGSK